MSAISDKLKKIGKNMSKKIITLKLTEDEIKAIKDGCGEAYHVVPDERDVGSWYGQGYKHWQTAYTKIRKVTGA
jgi:hypothetical protein